MGAEQSKYEGSPEILEARDLASVAKYMNSAECKNVFTMLGAGISTSAGIPDFRSPETGLYANLARLNLPYPEAVFEINYFRENPRAFYTLAHELLPGRFRPTPTHSFVRLLNDHKLLHTCFTQNIDTLERRAGVPGNKIVEAHGSFVGQHCIECDTECDGEKMRQALNTGEIARCPECDGLVKPDIVFFGESLPQLFHRSVPNLRNADLLFVIGTSLTVQPFASLASLVPAHCPRVLINLDAVGDFGSKPDDVICLGRCDDIVRDLCKALGWADELEAAWKETERSLVDFTEAPPEKSPGPTAEEEKKQLEQDVEEITDKMREVLGKAPSQTSSEETKGIEQSPVVTGAEIPVIEDGPQTVEDTAIQNEGDNIKETKEKL
ncbi:DHS-like NAD/FAD-binding domain-containing protein [Rhodofomes roseus]|uniref:NAD-dependent protein deacetylase n=1 Tax=Rhodofomes roseus TaxID=34475 RepID=A0A4Y9Z1X1_9APHY|nr:DHS-like NAD/FAD-binding domain-containing protein [Rhodofomes roseus]KAH9841595.1 DHS-like NAD/FAD-binding domain-containing protein [Rhodofomes roseus]TFY67861.1 hypothetical protein EVJ58_g1363 [Rhodofomes roseus]